MVTTEQLDNTLAYPFYKTKKGEIPFWDHPFLKGSKVLPKHYHPFTTIEGVLSLYRRRKFDDTDITILKVLGDSICSNEDQLRRYMASLMSRSEVSKRLNKFREVGLVDRWKIRIRDDEEENYKPPAPFTLGIAGFKLLKHYYSDQFFMDPNRWDKLGVGGIQRYVSMNEIRCQLVESRAVKQWKWNAVIAGNPRIAFPLGAAEIKTPKGHINFLIDRAQMSQNFIGYFKDKLAMWKLVYEKYSNLPLSEFPNNYSIVVIYTSTLSIAQKIHHELLLDTYPFPIWCCVEEDLWEDGLSKSFYIPEKENLRRVQLDFGG
jgi:DNA-binding transcriptional ArsR family regulator